MAQIIEGLAGRFRGCMVGSLMGDCLGAPFEGERRATRSVINNYFKKLSDLDLKVPYKPYTDDTAMTRCVAQSLIEQKGFEATDMAKKFVKEYYKDPNRGYGGNIINVFAALRATNYQDPYCPSQLQFNGSGSYGNGGAMRVSPVALFAANSTPEDVAKLAKDTALLTHSNRLGFNGAILQSLAVYYALKSSSEHELDCVKFVKTLIEDMKKIEPPKEDEISHGEKLDRVYIDRLGVVLDLLERSDSVSADVVEDHLGVYIAAHESVPTALYSFLRATEEISTLKIENKFERTIAYAISLGGDTDTIASMAGSIAGAFYGHDNIPDYLQRHCEGIDHAIAQADALYVGIGGSSS